MDFIYPLHASVKYMTGPIGRELISQAFHGQGLVTTTHTTPSTMLPMLGYWEEVMSFQCYVRSIYCHLIYLKVNC